MKQNCKLLYANDTAKLNFSYFLTQKFNAQ